MISKCATALTGAELDHPNDLLMTFIPTCPCGGTLKEHSDIPFLIESFSSTRFIRNFWRTIASLFVSLLVQSEQLSRTITKAD